MPDEKPNDDVEKVLADLKGIEGRKQALIDDLLRQKAEAVKAFDDKLAKLGYQAKDHAGKPQKSHHKKAPEKPKAPAGPSAGPSPAQTKTKRKA
jgi:hypothetical protein